MMKIIFIRHGKTAGNLEKRYIGRTDEPLCAEGIKELSDRKYPDCGVVFSSAMKRCVETAKLIYPGKKIITDQSLNECDFGDFEGKNYAELSGDPDYQKWIDSGGRSVFPNGESPDDFKRRCIEGFAKLVRMDPEIKAISFVVHGGTIMSVLERFSVPKKEFYDYMTANGSGFITEFDGEKIEITEKL